MDARQFYNMVVKMRKAQKDYEKLPSTRNRQKERVEEIKKNEAESLQQQLL